MSTAALATEPTSRRGLAVRTLRAGTERRDLQRTFRHLLATIWLLDAVLQLQPFMFTPGATGFSGMLSGLSGGNPGWVAHSINWNASVVAHHSVAANTGFALVQFLIAFGIVSRRTCKAALGLSVAWALGVWWFGEGLGGLLHGTATPFGGGPGAVLFYALIAVLLWPSEGGDAPFVAARRVGATAARAIWIAVWSGLSVLSVVGSGRSPRFLQGIVATMSGSQPGWLASLDRHTSSVLAHDGTTLAIGLAVICVAIGAAILLPSLTQKVAIATAVVLFAIIWVATENFGGILGGGATDPNSGLPIILFVLLYWPIAAPAGIAAGIAADPPAGIAAGVGAGVGARQD
ncbi:MAG TPA: hypothetical protein VGS21_04265 [Acidimicrobiales bacterium]|nr:hypothetical protein [Acidimicrobiales bacterium]